MKFVRPIAGVCALILFAGSLCAQRPQRPHRSGLWGELGGGGGHVRTACSGCTDIETSNGVASHFRIGGTVSDRVLIGFEAFSLLNRPFGFARADSRTSAETGSLAVIVVWFPGKRGLFFKGGVGAAIGEFVVKTSPTQVDTSQGGGMGVTFGMGWDWPISRTFAITGNIGAYITALGDIVLPARRVDDVIATMYDVSIGFTFR